MVVVLVVHVQKLEKSGGRFEGKRYIGVAITTTKGTMGKRRSRTRWVFRRCGGSSKHNHTMGKIEKKATSRNHRRDVMYRVGSMVGGKR